MFDITIFTNTFDNKTHRLASFKSWGEFKDLLYSLSEKEGKKGGRDSSPLISPAVYLRDSTRSNKSVDHWSSWCAIDVDDFEFSGDAAGLKVKLNTMFGHLDYVCYSTASSREDHLKFRLVFRLDEEIEANRIRKFWYALNTEYDDIGDKQTKDLSRMYYVPAIYPNAYNFIFDNEGDAVDVCSLISKHPFTIREGKNFLDRLPPELQDAVIQYRKDSLDNTNIKWTSYTDCPFFPKKLGAEYVMISGGGWYHKMYQIMVAIAGNAIKNDYPITSIEISTMCKEFDAATGNWYENRPLTVEADRAIEYIYRNGV